MANFTVSLAAWLTSLASGNTLTTTLTAKTMSTSISQKLISFLSMMHYLTKARIKAPHFAKNITHNLAGQACNIPDWNVEYPGSGAGARPMQAALWLWTALSMSVSIVLQLYKRMPTIMF